MEDAEQQFRKRPSHPARKTAGVACSCIQVLETEKGSPKAATLE